MKENKTRIVFTGDISFSGFFSGRENENILSDEILEYIKTADCSVVNMESPVTDEEVSRKERLSHRCSGDALDYIVRTFNSPVVSYANNHIMDYGVKGFLDSLNAAEIRGVEYIGAGKNLKKAAEYAVLGDEVRVAVMAVQYKNELTASEEGPGPLHEFEKKLIRKQIRRMKREADYAVIVYHGGNEFLHAPMPYIRRTLKQYISWGCDAVVAHHPHVVQGYEKVGDKMIFYSLGNFIFDTEYQRMQDYTDRGIILGMDFTDKGISWDVKPCVLDRNTMRIKEGEEDPHFTDIADTDYRRLWCRESLRKREVRKRADSLRESGKDRADDEIYEVEIVRSGRDRRRAFYRKLVMKTGQFLAEHIYR